MTSPNINVDRELGKLEAEILNLKGRQTQVEQDVKNEINTIKNDIKDFRKELQTDFKDLNNKIDDLNTSITELKTTDTKQKTMGETLTLVGSITITILTLGFTFYQTFMSK